MAQTVKINGVIYDAVTEVKLPLAANTSQMAVFPDTSDADAVETDLPKGKTAYARGKKLTGTGTAPVFSLTDGVLSIA